MSRKRITIFSWGYYGWGSATPQFVKAVDAVQTEQGLKPPIFVDVRLKRQGRAAGFKGTAFEKLLGLSRHRWMSSLGNLHIASHSGPRIQIADPSAAEELLDHVIQADEDGRRLLFFCGCQWPRIQGKTDCHRDRVSTLLLAAARRRGQSVEIVEWPGGKPEIIQLDLPSATYDAVAGAKQMSIPLGKRPDLARYGGLAYGTIIRIQNGPDASDILTGPALFQRGQWQLPCYWFCGNMGVAWARKKAKALRRSWGLDARTN